MSKAKLTVKDVQKNTESSTEQKPQPNSVGQFLEQLGLKLDDKQVEMVNKTLRFKSHKSKTTKNHKYVLFEPPTPNEKLPNQARVFINALTDEPQTIDEILNNVQGKLETRQDPRLVWTYYKTRLLEAGYIQEVE